MVTRTRIAGEIMEQAAARGPGRTLCPSEVARRLARDWRPLMPEVRAEAARLAAEGRLKATQRGAEVDALVARGPIRIGLPD